MMRLQHMDVALSCDQECNVLSGVVYTRMPKCCCMQTMDFYSYAQLPQANSCGKVLRYL